VTKASFGHTKKDVANKKPGQQISLFFFKRGNKMQIGNWQGVLYDVKKRTSDGAKYHIWFKDHVNHYWHGTEMGMGLYLCRRLKNKPSWWM
jgi:hypothetical protein